MPIFIVIGRMVWPGCCTQRLSAGCKKNQSPNLRKTLSLVTKIGILYIRPISLAWVMYQSLPLGNRIFFLSLNSRKRIFWGKNLNFKYFRKSLNSHYLSHFKSLTAEKESPPNIFTFKVLKSLEKHRPWLKFAHKEYRSGPGAPPLATFNGKFPYHMKHCFLVLGNMIIPALFMIWNVELKNCFESISRLHFTYIKFWKYKVFIL